MTDQELIKALREDAEWAQTNEWETPITLSDNLTAAANRIEALLKETVKAEKNIALLMKDAFKKDMAARKMTDDKAALEWEIECLKKDREHLRDVTKKLWCEKQYGKDTNVPTSTEGVE